MKKRAFSLLILILVALAVLIFTQYSKLNIISGYTAKYMASGVFIADRSVASLTDQDTNVPLIKLAEAEVNAQDQEASAEVFGLMERTAICRDGLGCVLINEDYEPGPYRKPNRNKVENPYPFGNKDPDTTTLKGVDFAKLEVALDSAFARPQVQKTRSVLVLHNNKILAERYADGFTADTPILGWSMTKSILVTLYGILQYEEQLDVETPAPVPGWQSDDRSGITYNHLLRMQSSLEWEEDYTKMSDVTRMLFMETDMSKAQAEKEAVGYPTQFWNYSSGTSNLLSGLLRDQFDTYQEYLDFPYAALIDKIGMHSMLIETDLAGNFVGSSYAWANTRDWAKFGALYLNKGVWNGERLFHEEWIEYISTPTEGSDGTYGAHFWLNAEGKYPDVPTDLYSANGYQGQYVFIIPSKDLVIVRTGLAEPPDFDINSFLKNIIDCIP
ncbi:MAG: beta-lactamase family protein [Bacteroidia bacterium]|nr:beta-lactamase family protein [Bacteroidia bacterium]